MTAAELSAAQWRALNNMASGYPALAGPDTITSLAERGLITRDGNTWRITRQGRAAHILDRRTT